MNRFVSAWTMVIATVMATSAFAQGSGSSRVSPPPKTGPSSGSNRSVPASPRPPTPAEFAASFWKYLHKPNSDYHRWGTPGKTEFAKATMPHSSVGQTYLNDVTNKNLKQVPNGSVLVRDELTADGKAIRNVSVMYRSKGADPKNGDWYWIVYQPDGKLAQMTTKEGNVPVAGRVTSCIACHQKAADKDFVFLNDRPAPNEPLRKHPTPRP